MLTLRGSMCAIATPFTAAGGLDLDAFARLIDYQIGAGTQGLVVAGSTGEAHFLDADEYATLVAYTVKHVAGRVPVIAGTGAAGTAQTVSATRQVADLGVDAALVVAPYYVRPTQEGLRRHFIAVAESSKVPVIVYNVPSRTGCDIAPATVAQLRDHPQIVGIKEAVGGPERVHALASLVRPDFAYMSGDDYTATDAMLGGAAGTVSVVANLAPQVFRQLCDAATAGDKDGAARHLATLTPLLDALKCAPNPIPVKAGVAALGFGDGSLRLPLVALEISRQAPIKAALAALSLRAAA